MNSRKKSNTKDLPYTLEKNDALTIKNRKTGRPAKPKSALPLSNDTNSYFSNIRLFNPNDLVPPITSASKKRKSPAAKEKSPTKSMRTSSILEGNQVVPGYGVALDIHATPLDHEPPNRSDIFPTLDLVANSRNYSNKESVHEFVNIPHAALDAQSNPEELALTIDLNLMTEFNFTTELATPKPNELVEVENNEEMPPSDFGYVVENLFNEIPEDISGSLEMEFLNSILNDPEEELLKSDSVEEFPSFKPTF